MLALLITLIALLVYYIRGTIRTYFRLLWCAYRIPAAPGALPILGHALKSLKNNNQLYNCLIEVSTHAIKHQGISTLWIGPYPVFLITDADAYRKLANVCLDKNYFYKYMKKFVGRGILAVDASTWKQRIKVLQPAFTTKYTDDYLAIFNEHCKPLLEEFEEKVGKGLFEHRTMLSYATIRMIFHSTFDMTLEELNITAKEYKDNFFRIEEIAMKRLRLPWLHYDFIYQFTDDIKQEVKAVNALHAATVKVLKKAKEDYAKKKAGLDIKMKPYLENLLNCAETGAITDEDIRAELDTIVVTGFESISVTMAINLLLLGAHPEVQEKVYEELYEIFGDSDREITKDDLGRMVYLDAAIKESSRYYPNAPFTGRCLDRDIQFNDYTLPAGATVFVSHWGINRQPTWGDDVEEYKPERWLDRATLPEGSAPDNSFGIGIRSCVGKAYAVVGMKSIMAHILRRFKVFATSKEIQFDLAISVQPLSGFSISVERR